MMNKKNIKLASGFMMMALALGTLTSCNGILGELTGKVSNDAAPSGGGSGGSGTGGSGGGGGGGSSSNPIVAGNGATAANLISWQSANVSGTGNATIPTTYGVIARLTNGLQGNVSSTAGNFAKALAQVQGNLPQSSDPTIGGGFDQIQLLVYAACTDLITGGANSKAATAYGVTPSTTVPSATVQAAIVKAGITMLNQYTAGMASAGASSASTTVNTVLTNLVSGVATTAAATGGAAATNTTTIAFVTACIAANTGGMMLGF